MRNLIKILFIAVIIPLHLSCSQEAKVVPPSQSTVGYVNTSPGTTLLTIQAIYPENGSINISRDTEITIVFSKGINASTLSGNISLTQGGTPVAYTFSPVPVNGDTIVHIQPSSQLGNNLPYTITVATGITSNDTTPQNLNAIYSSSFTTIDSDSAVAATQPRVLPLTRIPTNGASGISIYNEYIEVTFSDAVNPATVTAGSFSITGGIASGAPFAVAGSGNRIFRLPLNTASYSTSYTVTLTSAITTTGGAALLLDGNHTWSFTTEDAETSLPAAAITSVWLTDITATSAYINWVTTRPVASSTIDYGLTSSYGSSTNEGASPDKTVHSVQLTGLSSGKRYYFRITSDGVTSSGYFLTNQSGGVTNGTLLSDAAGNESLLHHIQRSDGSSFVIWKNGNDVRGRFIYYNGTPLWNGSGEVIDNGHNWSNIRSFSDNIGGVLVSGIDSLGDIRIKRVYDNPGFAFDSFWGESSTTAGLNGGTGTNQSVAIVWGGLSNANVDGGSVAQLRNGTAVVLDTSAYNNIFYDFDVDFTASTAIADNDIILNLSNNNKSNVADYANVTNKFRHAVNQDTANITAGTDYAIGSNSDQDTAVVANHVIYTTGDPPTNFGTYANPTSSVAGNEVYTSHGYNPVKGTWTVDSGDIFFDGISSYRGITTVTSNNFASTNTTKATGTNSGSTTSILSDISANFSSVSVGDLVKNTTTTAYSEIKTIVSTTELVLTDAIFSSTDNYEIYKKIKGGTSTNTTGEENKVFDSGFSSTTGLSTGDIVRKHDGDLFANDDSYSTVSTIDSDTEITLSSNIMDTSAGGTVNNYYIYDIDLPLASGTVNFSTWNTIFDTGKFGTVAIGDIAENTSTTTYSLITSIVSNDEVILNDSIFTAASQGYKVYSGNYCNTHFDSTMFTPFYTFTLNNTIQSDINNFTVYNRIKSGTADYLPANHLLDNNVATDFTAATAILLGDFVFNSSTGQWTRVESNAIYARVLSLNNNIFTVDGYGYYILRFAPAIPDGNILATGRAITPAANKLYSSVAVFGSAKKGDIVYNVTTGKYATVAQVNSNTELTLNKDIFTAADDGFIVFSTNEPVIETGINSSDTAILTDANANFTSTYRPVRPGDIVHNNDTGSETIVISVVDPTQLTLQSDIFTATGQRYSIYQPRILVTFQNNDNIYAELLRLLDGTDCGGTITIYDTASVAKYPVAISDNNGSAFVIYEVGVSIYGNKVSATGTVSGSSVIAGTGTIIDVVSDGANGIYVLYENGGNVYLTRRNINIVNMWNITVAGTAAVETDSVIILDSSNNPIVAYSSNGNIYISKFNPATGAAIYSSQIVHSLGYYTGNSDTRKSYISLVSDNNNGVIVSWIDSRYYYPLGYTIHATYVDSSGSRSGDVWDADGANGTVPNDYDGIQIGILNSYSSTEPLFIMSKYNDGALPWNPFIMWIDYRTPTDSAIYYNTVEHD